MSQERSSGRPLLWWLAAILAPVGIFGGPIALMDMLSGVIEWNGPLNYLVIYWDEYVGRHFHAVFAFVAALVNLPAPPDLLSDYLTLGILATTTSMRAHRLLQEQRELVLIGMVLVVVLFLAGTLLWPFYTFFILRESYLAVVQRPTLPSTDYLDALKEVVDELPENERTLLALDRDECDPTELLFKKLLMDQVGDEARRRLHADLEKRYRASYFLIYLVALSPFAIFLMLFLANAVYGAAIADTLGPRGQ